MSIGRLPERFSSGLSLPLIVAPMFLVSGVDLVVESCKSGAIGAIPTLNARSPEILDQWLIDLTARLENHRATGFLSAPWAVNLVVHTSNPRLSPDLEVCVRHKAPLIITALGGPRRIIDAVHSYGGLVFADVNSPEYARKAVRDGVDGLMLVCSGAGGHTGSMSPFAFASAVREFWNGTIVISGALSSGADLRAIQALDADLGCMGTQFIATHESLAVTPYKDMVVASSYKDIICTDAITGAWANKLRPSLVAAGLDPDNLEPYGHLDLSNTEVDIKAWRDLWSAGHAVGQVKSIQSTSQVITQIKREYANALARELSDPWRLVSQRATHFS